MRPPRLHAEQASLHETLEYLYLFRPDNYSSYILGVIIITTGRSVCIGAI